MQYRKSRQRQHILEILKATNTHPTADWIYHKLKPKMPNLSIGTVYRNLKILAEQGLIKKLPLGNTFDRYDAITDPHYHFTCERCGTVMDVDLPLYARINTDVEKKSNCTVTHHKIDFFGICITCRTKTT